MFGSHTAILKFPTRSVLSILIRGAKYDKALKAQPILAMGSSYDKDDERNYMAVAPAPKWQSVNANGKPTVNKFISIMMKDGDREFTRKMLQRTFLEIKHIQFRKWKKLPEDQRHTVIVNPAMILNKAVYNCTPVLDLRPVVRAALIYMVPQPPTRGMAQHKAIKMILDAAKEKPAKVQFHDSLAREILNAAANEGKAVRTKLELYRKCEENRAFASYRMT